MHKYSKVYANRVDENCDPTENYFEWAKSGWNSSYAQRYPMGKGAKPLYSYWDGEKYSYIEARQKIYIPLYRKAVLKTNAFKKLKEMYDAGEKLVLWDFDGYDFIKQGKSYEEMLNDPTKALGHSIVICGLLEEIDFDSLKIKISL